jgi:hypothetical protein
MMPLQWPITLSFLGSTFKARTHVNEKLMTVIRATGKEVWSQKGIQIAAIVSPQRLKPLPRGL